MAETKSLDEPTFHPKRKPDINSEDSQEHPNKAQKLATLDGNSLSPLDEAKECQASLNSNNNFEVNNAKCSSVTEEKIKKVGSDIVAEEDGGEDDGEFDNDVEDDDGDEDEDEDGEESNGKAEVDRKGKGITRADKGKGKLIEEDDEDEDDSDDDDSSNGGGVSDGDSDLSDDPLAEVDLNNILPSRTRRRTIHPGEYITNDLGNDNEDDDSDDNDV